LDEPTVGVDPILRQTIWYHLVSLCRSGLTIILTTHYIEEARSANVVGFMRDGKLLAEDNPNALLEKYLLPTLEDVFLKLCFLENSRQSDSQEMSCNRNDFKSLVIEKNEDKVSVYENNLNQEDISHTKDKCLEFSSLMNNDKESNDVINKTNQNFTNKICDKENEEITDQSLAIDYLMKNKTEEECHSNDTKNTNNVYIKIKDESNELNFLTENGVNDFSQKLLSKKIHIRNSHFRGKVSALLHKNFRRLGRNWGQLLFYIILPALQLALLLVSISGGPTNLNLAVFNEEMIENKTNSWGQLFINCIDSRVFNLKHYNSFESAYESVEAGKSWAFIDINDRFSSALRLRHLYGPEVDNETINESQIRVHIDWSNQAIGVQIERYFYEAMMKFAEQIALQSETNPDAVKIPLVFEQPVYGNRDESMRDFVLPGCYILLAFFSTAAVTSHLILEERRDGLLERSLVAGITAFEFLISHALTQFLILCLQISLMLLIPLVVFERNFSGSLSLLISLALSQGFCGIMYGLMISAICSDIIYAAMFSIVIFFISIIIGGVFWPIENMPYILRLLSHLTPSTLPIQSMRSILFRGWNLYYPQVYIGFIVTYVWFAFFVIIALVFLRKSF
jgi:ABC-type multidrug transport system ATPase subunit/ABC-type multidrug transport system permease subunit